MMSNLGEPRISNVTYPAKTRASSAVTSKKLPAEKRVGATRAAYAYIVVLRYLEIPLLPYHRRRETSCHGRMFAKNTRMRLPEIN